MAPWCVGAACTHRYAVAGLTVPPAADKNQANLVEAEERFREVQSAYEVLSDKHERAWCGRGRARLDRCRARRNRWCRRYDSHRDAILRPGTQQGGEEQFQATDDGYVVNLYQYFSPSCFSGYGDGAKASRRRCCVQPTSTEQRTQRRTWRLQGFYGVYSEVFAEVAQAELDAGTPHEDWPEFGEPGPGCVLSDRKAGVRLPPKCPARCLCAGRSTASQDQVARFYSFWLNFVSDRSFAWADKWNLATAPSRLVRRTLAGAWRRCRRSERAQHRRHLLAADAVGIGLAPGDACMPA